MRTAGDEPLVLTLDGATSGRSPRPATGTPTGAGCLWSGRRRCARSSTAGPACGSPTPSGARVLVDEDVSLGSGEGRIDIVDPQGLPLAVDKVGHLCRAFAATDDGVRDEILAGTQRALHDLHRGLRPRGVPQLRRAARRRARRRDDRPRLRHRRLLPEPRRVPGGPDPRVVPDRARAAAPRLDPAADVGRRHQAAPPAQRRTAVPHRRLRRLPGRRHLLPAREPERSAAGVRDPAALHDRAARVHLPGAGAPGADARVRVRAWLAGARPVVQVRRPGPGHPSARRLAARVPHRHGPVDRVLPRPEARTIRRRRSTFARWVDAPGPEAGGRRRPGLRHRARLPVLRPPRSRRRGVRLLPERAGPGRPSGPATRSCRSSRGC